MPKTHLTELSIKSLKPPARGQVTYYDDALRGFGVRVSQGGAKVFIVVRGKRRTRTTIGAYGSEPPDLSLAKAKAEAKLLLAERKKENLIGRRLTFNDAIGEFFETHCKVNNTEQTAKETKRLLENHFAPTVGKRQLDEVSTRDITGVLDTLVKKGRPGAANHAFAAARSLFRWARVRRYITVSPLDGLPLPSRPKSRDRVLTDAELVQVYKTAEAIGAPFGAIVQLLILTGQRRTEIASLTWKQINATERTITLPRTKNQKPHVFPYGDMVEHILNGLPKTSDYLFPAQGNGDGPFSGFSKAKPRFDRECRELNPEADVEPWTLHDLRRTFATNLAAIGTPIQVTEKLLNHVSGTMSGIVAVYQKYGYMAEMQAAIKAWEERLTVILSASTTHPPTNDA